MSTLPRNTGTDHPARDTTAGAAVGGFAGHEAGHGHTARDTTLGGLAGHEVGHRGVDNTSGTHGNRDALLGAGTGAAVGHGSGHTARDAAIGGVGGEAVGRHQGNAADTGDTGSAGGGGNPSKMQGKLEEIQGKVEHEIGSVTGSTSMKMKGEDKTISGQREQDAARGHV
ncbi:hypothetical protein GYMLUDRAFT_242451 [Collybiopsis luxurians FD-317 M1]|uniref:CsbD-like domain-containing protein n=1 Tax=Collybiopsis luxurians FD-317 M1 TaxID=944289 RepID=A0A0D0D152_9AGAR|nr:hypothetical protein GYMLUDRAFT_242451 [Collybiopsis luxurians FD-317 M1]